jgi:hypothetical protein
MVVAVVPSASTPNRIEMLSYSNYYYYCSPFATTNKQQQQHSLSSSFFPYYRRQQHLLFSCCSQSPLFRQILPCSRLQEISVAEEEHAHGNQSENTNNSSSKNKKDKDDDGEVGISKIQVPRQKHIPVSKSQLLDAILSIMLDQDVAPHFRLLTS